MALIDEGARSATVTATSDVVCLGLTYWEFRPLVQTNATIALEPAPDAREATADRPRGLRANIVIDQRVELIGLEPTTSSMPWRRSTN